MPSRRPFAFQPLLLLMEDRIVPAPILRETTGTASPASIQGVVDQFRADLGTLNPNNPGSVGSGRREINWDGVPDDVASPALLPGDFFNADTAGRARGVLLATSGAGLLVSQDGDTPPDADPDQARFSDINTSYATAFSTFTPERIFAAKGSNVIDVTFRVPGTNESAVVRGFGAVFTDVDVANSTRVEFFDANGGTVFTRNVLASPGDGALSFLGVSFPGGDAERIARVRLTLGNATLGTLPDITQGGPVDVVALDDFIYGEPTPAPAPFAVGNGSGNTVQIRNSTGGLVSQFTAFDADFTGGVRTATADFNGDGIPDTVVGTGPGRATQVRIISGADHTTNLLTGGAAEPFEPSFTGGVFVATGDINDDGVPDLVITPDEGGGPRARVFSGKDFKQIADFFGINDPNFRGGARAALGNVNGKGPDDLIVVAGFGGGPRVATFDGAKVAAEGNTPGIQTLERYETWKLFGDFLIFEETLRNGVFVASGDFNGDAVADYVFGGGPGGGPRVQIISGKDLVESGGKTFTTLGNFFAGDSTNRGGIRVASANLDFDNLADLVVGNGTGAGSRFSGYHGMNIGLANPLAAFSSEAFSGATNGVFVG